MGGVDGDALVEPAVEDASEKTSDDSDPCLRRLLEETAFWKSAEADMGFSR